MSEVIFDPNAIDFDRPGKWTYEVAFHYDGTWGYTLVPLTVINGAGPRKASVVAFGGTHGNEYEGQVAVWRLMHDLDPTVLNGRVILMPRLNTPACITGTRESRADGVNMNRAFPGNPHGSLTYRIADFVTTRVFPRVEVVLDIHAGGTIMQFALCTSFHVVEDPKQFDEMVYVAGLFDPPFISIYAKAMAHGLLTDQAEALGKVTIGGEFGYASGVWHKGAIHAYEGIKNVLRHYGILPGPVTRIDPERGTPPKLVSSVDLADYIPAPITGVFEPLREPGFWAAAGHLVGRLYDFERVDDKPFDIVAPRSGYVLMQPFQAPIAKGDTMIMLANEVKR